MNKVTVLVEGYAHQNQDGTYSACPTCTLVESNGIKFLVDPGTNSEKLTKALKENGLSTADISFIYLSHYHPDHLLCIRNFSGKDIYDGEICWRGDLEIFHNGKLPGVDVQILKTPGHSAENTSIIVKTEQGVVCISSDVFWWEDGKQKSDNFDDLVNLEDPFASDVASLQESRKTVLQLSDWIIPGHGKKFKSIK